MFYNDGSTIKSGKDQSSRLKLRCGKVAHGRGFTLIELMIVIAVIAILLSIALPTYSNYTVRARIAEGLSVANAAKTSTADACQADNTIDPLTNTLAGYEFGESTSETAYIEDILISGPCIAPVITIRTKNTGVAGEQPILTLEGDFTLSTGRITWTCGSSNTPNYLLPDTCRT